MLQYISRAYVYYSIYMHYIYIALYEQRIIIGIAIIVNDKCHMCNISIDIILYTYKVSVVVIISLSSVTYIV